MCTLVQSIFFQRGSDTHRIFTDTFTAITNIQHKCCENTQAHEGEHKGVHLWLNDGRLVRIDMFHSLGVPRVHASSVF